MHNPHLGSGEPCPPALRSEYLYKFSSARRFTYSPPLISLFHHYYYLLYQHKLVDIYLIVLFLIEQYTIYCVAHIFLALVIGSTFSWFCVSLTHHCGFIKFLLFFFFEHFFTFWHYRMLQAHLVYFSLQLQTQLFLQRALKIEIFQIKKEVFNFCDVLTFFSKVMDALFST